MANLKSPANGKSGMDMTEHNKTWSAFIKGVLWGAIITGALIAFLVLVIVLHWNVFGAAFVVGIGAAISAYIFSS
jgi:uncharacterized protein (DUF2062 family)